MPISKTIIVDKLSEYDRDAIHHTDFMTILAETFVSEPSTRFMDNLWRVLKVLIDAGLLQSPENTKKLLHSLCLCVNDEWELEYVAKSLELLKEHNVCQLTEHLQDNLNALVWAKAQNAWDIYLALQKLAETPLIQGESAQKNIAFTIQGNGRYAWSICSLISQLNDAYLLLPAKAHANFTVIMQCDMQCIRVLTDTLNLLKNARLLATPEEAQMIFDIITQDQGKYLKDFKELLQILLNRRDLASNQLQEFCIRFNDYLHTLKNENPLFQQDALDSLKQDAQYKISQFKLRLNFTTDYQAPPQEKIIEPLRRISTLPKAEKSTPEFYQLGKSLSSSMSFFEKYLLPSTPETKKSLSNINFLKR